MRHRPSLHVELVTPGSEVILLGGGAVGFEVINLQQPDAGPVIYIGQNNASDAAWGRLSLQIVNNTGGNDPIVLDQSSLLKVYLDSLLNDADINLITVSDQSQWSGGPVHDSLGVHLELRPRAGQTITIASEGSCAIEIDHALGSRVASGQFKFFYQKFPGVADGKGSVPGFVHNRPGARQWELRCEPISRADYPDAGDTIYVTHPDYPDIVNHVLIKFYHSEGGTLPYAPTARLMISFVTEGDLALCDEDQLKVVNATIAEQSPPGRWLDPPAKDTTGGSTVWTLQPTDDAGSLFPIEAVVVVAFDNLVSKLPAGKSAPLFVHYSGLPGYDDGYRLVMLSRKEPVPLLRDFFVVSDGARVPLGGKTVYGATTLHWDVFGVNDCLVGLAGENGTAYPSIYSIAAPTETPEFSYTLVPRANGIEYPPYLITFQLAPPVASISATLEHNWAVPPLQFPWTFTATWHTKGAKTCQVSHPYFGTISTKFNDTAVETGFASIPDPTTMPNSIDPCRIDVTNPAGSISVNADIAFRSPPGAEST